MSTAHVTQLESAGFRVEDQNGHIHVMGSARRNGKPVTQQVAVYRSTTTGDFADWGWVATWWGRVDVHDWDEFLAALALHEPVVAP